MRFLPFRYTAAITMAILGCGPPGKYSNNLSSQTGPAIAEDIRAATARGPELPLVDQGRNCSSHNQSLRDFRPILNKYLDDNIAINQGRGKLFTVSDLCSQFLWLCNQEADHGCILEFIKGINSPQRRASFANQLVGWQCDLEQPSRIDSTFQWLVDSPLAVQAHLTVASAASQTDLISFDEHLANAINLLQARNIDDPLIDEAFLAGAAAILAYRTNRHEAHELAIDQMVSEIQRQSQRRLALATGISVFHACGAQNRFNELMRLATNDFEKDELRIAIIKTTDTRWNQEQHYSEIMAPFAKVRASIAMLEQSNDAATADADWQRIVGIIDSIDSAWLSALIADMAFNARIQPSRSRCLAVIQSLTASTERDNNAISKQSSLLNLALHVATRSDLKDECRTLISKALQHISTFEGLDRDGQAHVDNVASSSPGLFVDTGRALAIETYLKCGLIEEAELLAEAIHNQGIRNDAMIDIAVEKWQRNEHEQSLQAIQAINLTSGTGRNRIVSRLAEVSLARGDGKTVSQLAELLESDIHKVLFAYCSGVHDGRLGISGGEIDWNSGSSGLCCWYMLGYRFAKADDLAKVKYCQNAGARALLSLVNPNSASPRSTEEASGR